MRSLVGLSLPFLAGAIAATVALRGQDPPAPPKAEATPIASKDTYRPYRGHDVAKVVTVREAKDGTPTADLDGKLFATVLDDLESHAKNYPPKFRTKEEQALAHDDAQRLGEMLAIVLEPQPGRPEQPVNLLLLAGRFEAIAHNLDVKGASTRALGYFERLLKQQPDHVEGNFHFGAFLAGTATLQKRALPHLEKALKLGEKRALWPLALVNLMGDQKAKGLEHLKAYVEAFPADESGKQLLKSIESGDAKVERRVHDAPGEKPKDR